MGDIEAPLQPSASEVHRMRFKIPAGLSCTHCTLQWYWSTGNTCLYDAGYFSYFSKMSRGTEWCNFCTQGAECSGTCCGESSGKFAEEFWNCADIAVNPSDGLSPMPLPSPSASPTPLPMPSPMPSPSPSQTPTPMACAVLCDRTGVSVCTTLLDQSSC